MDDDLKQHLEDLKRDADCMEDVIAEAREDTRFINVDGGMWEDFLTDEFSDRTRLEFDQVSDYVNRFLGEWNQNRVGVEFTPGDDRTTDDDADFLNGLFRADFRYNSGKMAVDNAVDELATCGYGAVKLATVFEDEEDPENDNQRIEFRPVHNAYCSVFWDSAAKRIDKKDASHCTQLVEFTPESFEDKYPGKKPVSAYDFQGGWSGKWRSSSTKPIYVGIRYEVQKKTVDYHVYHDLESGEVLSYTHEDHEKIKDELKQNELVQFSRVRKINETQVMKTVFSGEEVLEAPKRIAGKRIPIIPLYGYHSYIEGEGEYYRGLVRKLKDPARLFNVQISQLAENAASSGQDVPIFTPEQMEGLGHHWANRNNKPYLLANPIVDASGNPIHQGPIGYAKPPQLDGNTTALLGIVPDYIRGSTGGAPQETLDPDASGKAIKALIKRENLNTQTLNDNIENGMACIGEVYQWQAREVYNTRRKVRTVGLDGTEKETQVLGLVLDEESGQMVASNTLDRKRFNALASAGPQYDSLREEEVEANKGLLEVVSQHPSLEKYVAPIVATIIENQVGSMSQELRDMNRKEMILQGLRQPETDEEKAFLRQAQQPQEDANEALAKAAAEQQLAEAQNLIASSEDKLASADKKRAETAKIVEETEGVGIQNLIDIRTKTLNQLPI